MSYIYQFTKIPQLTLTDVREKKKPSSIELSDQWESKEIDWKKKKSDKGFAKIKSSLGFWNSAIYKCWSKHYLHKNIVPFLKSPKAEEVEEGKSLNRFYLTLAFISCKGLRWWFSCVKVLLDFYKKDRSGESREREKYNSNNS